VAVLVAASGTIVLASRRSSPVSPVVPLLAAGALWLAAPDTEPLVLVGGALVVPVIVAVAGDRARTLTVRADPVAATAVVAAAVLGLRGRTSSLEVVVVAAVFLIGPALATAVGRRLTRGGHDPGPRRLPVATTLAALIGTVVLATGARTVGLSAHPASP
jgi:hypothetical protein